MQLGQFNQQTMDSICKGCIDSKTDCQKKQQAAKKGFCSSYYRPGSCYEKAVEEVMANHGAYR